MNLLRHNIPFLFQLCYLDRTSVTVSEVLYPFLLLSELGLYIHTRTPMNPATHTQSNHIFYNLHHFLRDPMRRSKKICYFIPRGLSKIPFLGVQVGHGDPSVVFIARYTIHLNDKRGEILELLFLFISF